MMQHKQKVKTIYEEIRPALEIFDWRRKEALKKTTDLSVVLFVICLIVVGVVSLSSIATPLKLFIASLVAAVSIGISTTYRRKYIKKFKKDLSELLFDREGIQATHESFNQIYSGHFKQSDLFEEGNEFTGEDLITGVKGDLYFIGSELRAAYVRRRKNLPDINRFGFNGKEKDDGGEWGSDTNYDYGFRIYNPRIGKFLSVDPLAKKYAGISPYAFVGNMPNLAMEVDGRYFVIRGSKEYKQFINRQLALLQLTDAGRQVYLAIKNSPHPVTIREARQADYEAAKHRLREVPFTAMHISDAEIASYNDRTNTLLINHKSNLSLGLFSSTDILPVIAHELYHAYTDNIDYENKKSLLEGDRKYLSNNQIMEWPAMAFENYIRDIFSFSRRSQYGYKAGFFGKNEIAKRFDALFYQKHNPNDLNSKIEILSYGINPLREVNSMDNVPSLGLYIATGEIKYTKQGDDSSQNYIQTQEIPTHSIK